jgi:hypothetical protein
MNRVTRRLVTMLAIGSVALLAIAGSAQAALSVTPTRTFGMASLHAFAPDGTIWTTPEGESSTASFSHYDDEGNDLGDGFSVTHSSYYPLSIAAWGGRVYVTVAGSSFGQRLITYLTSDFKGPGHDFLAADEGTSRRIGGNQAIMRVFSNGGGVLALGQENKVGTFNAEDLTATHPFYPQGFHGAGINQNFTAEPPLDLESCTYGLNAVPVAGEPDECGRGGGRYGVQGPDGVSYPIDVAPGLGGLFIAEKDGDQITHYNTVANPGATLDLRFGIGPGSAAGQIDEPQSIVIQPSTNLIYVSEGGNRRISVFGLGGNYIASFGYGVLTGADQIEVCGLEIGACRAGVPYQSDSRSYFSRLDFGPDGDLYAYMPIMHQVQVFSVGGGTAPSTPTGSLTPKAPNIPPPPAEKDKVRIKANPLAVKKGKKTKLTAIVNPPTTCQKRLVLFQLKEPRSWDNLGKALKTKKNCTASKLVKVTAKSVYRAVLIDASNHATLGYSPKLTIKLK